MPVLTDFANAHPLLFGLLVWPILSAIVTGIFGALGHMSATDFAKLPKWLAAFVRIVASSGFDAPRVLALLGRLFGRSTPPVVGFIVGCALFGIPACAFFKSPQGATTAVLVVRDAMCVLNHADEPVLKILADCNLPEDAAQVVVDILTKADMAAAKRTIAAKAAAKDAGVP